MLTQVGVKQLTDFLRTVTAASDSVDCTLVNCALAKVVYLVSAICTPTWAINEINKLFFQFVW